MVVDLLHEFELGVWKSLFTHLIRILHAASERPGALADILNTRSAGCDWQCIRSCHPNRFRQIPTFGRYTIRRFHNNVSDMKKLAARDFEDILQACPNFPLFAVSRTLLKYGGQCSIPVFEGLLPEPFNGMLLRLLYKAAEWQALAKLRMHTDSTLDLLEAVTGEFGRLMRQFRDRTSDKFDTVELPRETGAQKGGARSSKKKLNLNTYKFHALGDYVATIRRFGTTDSYSTQVVSSIVHCTIAASKFNFPQGELAHRLVKRLYGLTNKKDAAEQISRRYRRAHHFGASESCDPPQGDTLGGHDKPDGLPELHHTMSNSRNNPVQLTSLSSSSTQDPAAKVHLHPL